MLSYGYSIGGDLSSTSLMTPDELDKIILSPSKSKFIVIGTINEILEWMKLNKNVVCEYEDNDNIRYNMLNDNNRLKNHHNRNNDNLKTKKLVTFNKPKKSSTKILFVLYAFTKQQQQQHNNRHHNHFQHNLSLCKKIFSLNKVDKMTNFPSSLSSTTIFRLVIKFENTYIHKDTIIEEGNDERNGSDESDESDEDYMLIKRSKCIVGVTLMQVLNVWTRNLENHQHKKDIERARLDSDFDY